MAKRHISKVMAKAMSDSLDVTQVTRFSIEGGIIAKTPDEYNAFRYYMEEICLRNDWKLEEKEIDDSSNFRFKIITEHEKGFPLRSLHSIIKEAAEEKEPEVRQYISLYDANTLLDAIRIEYYLESAVQGFIHSKHILSYDSFKAILEEVGRRNEWTMRFEITGEGMLRFHFQTKSAGGFVGRYLRNFVLDAANEDNDALLKSSLVNPKVLFNRIKRVKAHMGGNGYEHVVYSAEDLTKEERDYLYIIADKHEVEILFERYGVISLMKKEKVPDIAVMLGLDHCESEPEDWASAMREVLIDDYDLAMRELLSFVSAGGFNSEENLSPKVAVDRIKEGINALTTPKAKTKDKMYRSVLLVCEQFLEDRLDGVEATFTDENILDLIQGALHD